MRYVDFAGIVPKYKPQILGGKHGVVAHNLDLVSGRLESFGAPLARVTMVDSAGNPFVGTAKRVYYCNGYYVAWPTYTFVAPDTQGGAGRDTFLFVEGGNLYWQEAQRLAQKLPAVKMGICPPEIAPTTTVLVGLGCRETAPIMDCVDPTNPTATCNNGDTPEIRSYVYTYIRPYPGCFGRFEESAPSFPTSVEVSNGDAVSLSSPPLPAGVTALRWYRAVTGATGAVWLEVGESTGSSIVDGKCVGELGLPLASDNHFPPPSCLEGVAVLGDNLTVVWSGRQMYVSQERAPYAFNTDEHTYDFPYNIVGMRGTIAATEMAQTYELHVLTEGTPFAVRAVGLEKVDIRQEVGRDGRLAWHPCVSKESITDLGGSTGYASPYGFVTYSGSAVDNLTEAYYTEKEWQQQLPAQMVCTSWLERVFIAHPTRSGLVLTIAPDGGMRPKMLVTHDVCATAWCVDPRLPLMLARQDNNQIYEWGVGAPLTWEWQSEVQVQSGLWRPATIKVVHDHPRAHHDQDEFYAAYTKFYAENPTTDKGFFFDVYPQYRSFTTQVLGGQRHDVTIFCDNREIDHVLMWNSTKPLRIRRRVRGLEWSVKLRGVAPVREIHMQTSHMDLAQEGGMA